MQLDISDPEPQFPPIPDVGEHVLGKKGERFIQEKFSELKCDNCQAKYTREFKRGDFTFKVLTDEQCEKCHSRKLNIVEIYSKWIDPKKKKKK